MLLTVSTVKDTLPHLREFVARNTASGVDHLIVFVDDGDREVVEGLAQLDHVTAVGTGPRWWHGKRPQRLNIRQRANANVARALLAPFDWAEWVFHIDSDECLQVDRAALADLPEQFASVRAETLEAVSRAEPPAGAATHFKTQLDDDRLQLLQVLGVIEEADNGCYFHGHIEGKSGIRPRMDRWLGLHAPEDITGRRIPGRPGLARVLHYESWSADEFVRKWTAILGSGATVRLRPGREPVAAALRALAGLDLGEQQRTAFLRRIYERTTEDDVATLHGLGLLAQIDPLAGAHRPEPLGPERSAVLGRLLDAVRPESKWVFESGRTAAGMLEALARTAARLDADPEDAAGGTALVEQVRRAWTLPDDVVAEGARGWAARAERRAQAGQGSA